VGSATPRQVAAERTVAHLTDPGTPRTDVLDSPGVTSTGEGGSPAVKLDVAAQEDAGEWEALVARITHGDGEAEAALALQFYPRILAMARARLHGAPAAADITQDTILAVLEALRAGRIREPARLPAFVLSTARNLINGFLRNQTRSREVLRDPPQEPGQNDPTPFELDDEQRFALVGEALDRLKPIDQQILRLTLVEGMTSREIAPLVGLDPGAVRTRRARAVKVVTRRIEKMTRGRRSDYIRKSGLRP
jgi:RNA polymerase sigma-70 factor (ECF subfamily)